MIAIVVVIVVVVVVVVIVIVVVVVVVFKVEREIIIVCGHNRFNMLLRDSCTRCDNVGYADVDDMRKALNAVLEVIEPIIGVMAPQQVLQFTHCRCIIFSVV